MAVKSTLSISDDHGPQYLFVISAVAILISAVYATLFMPETHGLTLENIQKIYVKEAIEVICY